MSMAIYDFPGIEDQDSLSPLWSSLQRGNLQKVLGTKENFIVEYHKKWFIVQSLGSYASKRFLRTFMCRLLWSVWILSKRKSPMALRYITPRIDVMW